MLRNCSAVIRFVLQIISDFVTHPVARLFLATESLVYVIWSSKHAICSAILWDITSPLRCFLKTSHTISNISAWQCWDDSGTSWNSSVQQLPLLWHVYVILCKSWKLYVQPKYNGDFAIIGFSSRMNKNTYYK